MKKILTSLALACVALVSTAQDAQLWRWETNADGTATLVCREHEHKHGDRTVIARCHCYSGNVVIPDTTADGRVVTGIGKDCFYDCSVTSVKMPKTLVTIGEYAFHSCTAVSEITIPASVDTIGYGAFNGMTSLAEVIIEDSPNVLKFGGGGWTTSSGTFTLDNVLKKVYIGRNYRHPIYKSGGYDCGAFVRQATLQEVTLGDLVTEVPQNAFYICPSLKTVHLGAGIRSIGESAFYHCDSLVTINLPEGLTVIGNGAFYECPRLTGITLPSTLTFIDRNAFSGCKSIRQITIPASVDSIATGAFNSCEGLTSLTLEDTPRLLRMASGGYYTSSSMFNEQPIKTLYIGRPYRHNYGGRADYNNHAFSNSKTLETVVVSDNLTEVYQNMFYNDPALKTVTLGKNIASIGDNAFARCTGLTTVNLPEGLTVIGGASFYDCQSLKDVTFPSTLNLIKASAFTDCESLTSVTIPASVDSIGNAAFGGCSGVKTYVIEDSPNVIHLGGGFNSRSLDMFRSLETFYIGRDFTCPFDWYSTAFFDHPTLRQATISGHATQVTESMFTRCSKLEKVTLGPNVKTIRQAAFNACTSLRTIDEGRNIETIEPSAFYNCTSLPTLPDISKLKIIEASAFYGCESLTSVTIPATIDSIGNAAFGGCSGVKTYVIEDSPNAIHLGGGSNSRSLDMFRSLETFYLGRDFTCPFDWYSTAFYDHPTLREATIGGHATQVTENMFTRCSKLETVTLGPNVRAIRSRGFNACTSLRTVGTTGNLETIEASAFYDCKSLQAMPDISKVRVVSEYAFSGCESLASLTIPASVDSIGRGAFGGLKGVTEITIADADTELKMGSSNMFNAYNYAESLKCLYVGRDFRCAGGSTLVYNCASIEDVTYGDRVTRINEQELRACGALKSVTLGRNVATIGSNAFYEDKALQILTVNATVPPTFTSGDPFYRVDKSNVTLLVPFAALNAYKTADVWKDFLNVEGTGEPVPVTIDVAVADVGYATFYDSENSYQLPEGLTARVVTGYSSQRLTYHTLTDGIVPRGVAVLLTASVKQAATYTLTSTTADAAYTGDNLLRGSDAATVTSAADASVFYKLSFGHTNTSLNKMFGWFWGAADGAAFGIEGHRAWLALPRGVKTRGYALDDLSDVDESLTGDADADVPVFDLQGRRMGTATAKGIYIRSNHKVVVK